MNKPFFVAKVRPKAKIFHYWKSTECKGLFESRCNPGLTRCTSELFEISGKEKLCRICESLLVRGK